LELPEFCNPSNIDILFGLFKGSFAILLQYEI
jgi:hypothetical protein